MPVVSRENITIQVDQLQPYPRNARTHSDYQIKQLANFIKQVGYIDPIIIDETDMILAGHGRALAALRADINSVPCVRIAGLTESEKRAYVIADNKLALNAGWDDDLLKAELDDLMTIGDIDISVIGFTDDELKIMDIDFDQNTNNGNGNDNDPDDIPEVEQNVYGVERGDIWQLGKHRIMCGDSTSRDDIEALMSGEKADMVFTDPPYGMNLDTDYSKMPISPTGAKPIKHKKIIGDDKDFDPCLILKLFEKCDEIFLFGADYYAKNLPRGSWIVWDKRVTENFDRMIGSAFELCWSKKKHKREIVRCNNTLYSGERDAVNKVHPTQKPIKLIEWFFDRFKGDLVADLFLGSGSTLIACEKTGRKCYGMEIDPHYCSVIIKRYEIFSGDKAFKL